MPGAGWIFPLFKRRDHHDSQELNSPERVVADKSTRADSTDHSNRWIFVLRIVQRGSHILDVT